MRVWANPKTSYTIAFFLGLISLLYFIYSPVFHAPYSNTDDALLINIPQVQEFSGIETIRTIFTPGQHVDYYPIRDLSYVLDQFLGPNPKYTAHIQQFFWFILTILFFFLILLELKVAWHWALFCTALWALHPVHTEMISWISARKDILALAFFSISAYLFLSQRESLPRLVLSIFFFILCSLSKSSFIAFPIFLLLFFSLYKKWISRKQYLSICASALFAAAFSLLNHWQYTEVNDMRMILPPLLRLETSLVALGKMLVGLFYTSVNIFDPDNLGEWAAINQRYLIPGIAFWILLFFGSVLAILKKNIKFLLFLFSVLAAYLPISGLLFPHSSFYSARYIEPMFCVFTLGIAIFFLPKRNSIFTLACLVPFAFSWQSRNEALVWSQPTGVEYKAYSAEPSSLSLQSFYWARLIHLPNSSERNFLTEMLANNCDNQTMPQEITSPMVNCRAYYRYKILLNRWNKKMDISDKYLRLFEDSQTFFEPKPGAIARLQLESMLRKDQVDLDLYSAWLTKNRYQPTPEYRFLKVVGDCLLSSQQSEALAHYRKMNLLTKKKIEEFLEQIVGPELRVKIRNCLTN